MPFSRFVQVGRVVLVNFGDNTGKLAIVVTVVDQNKVLLDGNPGNDAFINSRAIYSIKQVQLTDIVADVTKASSVTEIRAAADATGKTFAATGWGKGIAKKALRAGLNDFQRFKVMQLRKKRAKALAAAM